MPEGENDEQGDLIARFYEGQRVLNGDAFWVEM